MATLADLNFKPTSPASGPRSDGIKRPDQPVYDPDDHSIVMAPYDTATELAKGGYTIGGEAYNRQLNESFSSKAGSFLTGVADGGTLGGFGALKALTAKMGDHQDLTDLRLMQQAQKEHPGYHLAGELAPMLAEIPLGGGAFSTGSIGRRLTEAAGKYGRAGELAAKGANGLAAGMPAFVAKEEADAFADAVAGHKEEDLENHRTRVIQDPVTAELLWARGMSAVKDVAVGNAIGGAVIGALKGGAWTAKGALGLAEEYAILKRKWHPAPTGEGNGDSVFSAYTRVDHADGAPTMSATSQGRILEGEVAGEGPKALGASAGPDGQVPAAPLPNTYQPDGGILDAGIPLRPEARGDALAALRDEHGAIGLPGDHPGSHEVAPGIPRAGLEIPKAAEPEVIEAKYAGDPELQASFDIATAKLKTAEQMAAEAKAAEAIPKRDVGAAPAKPVPPEFDAANTEPVFEYGADYKQRHKLEALRRMTLDRLTKAGPEALQKYELNRTYTKAINALERDRTPVDWTQQYHSTLQAKMANKEELKAMVPRIYDSGTKEYAPSFADLNDEYRRVVRGDVAATPTITFGAKGDPKALAEHAEQLKQWSKDINAHEKEVARAEKEHLAATKTETNLAASEAKRVKAAVDKAQAEVAKAEKRIASDKAAFENRVAREKKKAQDSFERHTKRASDKAAKELSNARNAAERQAIKAAEKREREVAIFQKKAVDAQIKDVEDAGRAKMAAEHDLALSRAKAEKKVAAEAEKQKTLAAKEAKKKAAEDDKYAKAQKKAQEAAMPRFEESATRTTTGPGGVQVETIHSKTANGKTTSRRVIRIKANKKKPDMIAGDLLEPFSTGDIAVVGGGSGLLFGAHTGGLVTAGLYGVNKFVKYGLNSQMLHRTFAGAMGQLERNIVPMAKRLGVAQAQRGRRQEGTRTVNIGHYQHVASLVGYVSQNPTAIQEAIDQRLPNLGHEHPELTTGIKVTASKAFQALNDHLPKKPYDAPLKDSTYNPPRATQVAFVRRYQILSQPQEALASGDPIAIKLVQQVYPNLYREYCSQLTHYVQEHKPKMGNRQARLISQFLGANVRPIDDPAALQRLQATGGPEPAPDGGQKPIGKSNAPTRAASQRASIDSPDADIESVAM